MSYILIAEDDRDILILVQRRLEMSGYTNLWSTINGAQALEQALKEPPRLMILDVVLQGLDGLSVCSQVKAALAEKAPPIIIMSTRGQSIDVTQGKMAGADIYLIKPFAPRELIAHVEALIG